MLREVCNQRGGKRIPRKLKTGLESHSSVSFYTYKLHEHSTTLWLGQASDSNGRQWREKEGLDKKKEE